MQKIEYFREKKIIKLTWNNAWVNSYFNFVVAGCLVYAYSLYINPFLWFTVCNFKKI